MAEKSTELKDRTFNYIVDYGVQKILEEVMGGKSTLRGAVYAVCELSARWSHQRLTHEHKTADNKINKLRAASFVSLCAAIHDALKENNNEKIPNREHHSL